MKKSVEIIGLPIISITDGRELGMSKSLLIDAKKGAVAAITIEDEDWYRGVKLLPYESVIAIGADAVTITTSENILKLEDAADYENMLDENIRIIGTKAITKSGTIQGKVTEIYVGDNGGIEKCEIASADGASSEITADQISIFGKQVTVIDPSAEEKKTESAPVKQPEKAEPAVPAHTEPKEAAKPVENTPEPKKEAPVENKPAEKPAEPARTAAPAKAEEKPADANKQMADKATEERHRRFLLGKKASRRIAMDNGVVIVEAGADITEEVLQKAKLANKIIELSMNVQ